MNEPGWGGLAALTAAAAAWLIWAPLPRLPRSAVRSWRPHASLLVAALVVGGAWLAARSAHLVVLAGIGVAMSLGARTLVRRGRRRQGVETGQAEVLGFCQGLASELAAGQPPRVALERAAEETPGLTMVAGAARLGGDVPTALRAQAGRPGYADLAFAAAAWEVAQQSGAGLAAAASRVADGLRATQATRRVVRAELASARATARLLAGLPVLALAMGSGIGGDPFGFLFSSLWGLLTLAAGLAFGFVGLVWIEAIADQVAAGVS